MDSLFRFFIEIKATVSSTPLVDEGLLYVE